MELLSSNFLLSFFVYYAIVSLRIESTESISDKLENGIQKIKDAMFDKSIEIDKAIDDFLDDSSFASSTNTNDLNCLGFPKGIFSTIFEAVLSDVTRPEYVKFYFSSRTNKQYTTAVIANFSTNATNFDFKKDTYILSHGFLSSGMSTDFVEMKDALLSYSDANVIVTDWKKGANTLNYVGAAASTRVVGEQIANLVMTMKKTVLAENAGQSSSNRGQIHMIGHSLGAHIVGRAAKLLRQNKTNTGTDAWIADRITGLDPAEPCFQSAPAELKLTRDDANFVDIIHSNARNLLLLGLGLSQQLGYFDFFPNGGFAQPGCLEIDSVWEVVTLPVEIIKEVSCSHGRSHVYFTESIRDEVAKNCSFVSHAWDKNYAKINSTFLGKACPTGAICPEMGINAIKYYSVPGANGTYFTPVGRKAPYCTLKESEKPTILKEMKAYDIAEELVNF